MHNLPPPPPLPESRTATEAPRPPVRPFDIIVVCISLATLLGIVLFLFPHERQTLAIDNVIRLDAPSSSASSNPETPATSATSATSPSVGSVYEGLLTDVGSGKSTKGLPKLKLLGCTVYVRGAERGQTARFRIVEEKTSTYGDGKPYFFAEAVSADTPLTKEVAP